jgi:hypothetical protein
MSATSAIIIAMSVNHKKRLKKELAIIALSILLAIFLVRMGVIGQFLEVTYGLTILASFISGMFFTSVFTIAPASIALAQIAKGVAPLEVALFGALGAMVGDLIIYLFIRDTVGQDIVYAIKHSKYKRFISYCNLGIIRFLTPVIGGLIIISPLPDEFGLAILGINRMKVSFLLPLTFALNFVSVYIIAVIAQSF